MVAVAVDNVEIGKIVGDVNMAIIADSIMITVLEVGDVITAILVVEGDVTTAIMVVEEEIATMTITKY